MTQPEGKFDPVHYSDGVTPVLVGDHVAVRGMILFFLKKNGRMIYVPGISRLHPDLERDGLREVWIDFDDGTATAMLVEPETNCLQKAIRFLGRGDANVRQLAPEKTLDDYDHD